MMPKSHLLKPTWPAPENITAFTTLKECGDFVNDRKLLKTTLQLPTDPIWLKLTHGTTVVKAIPANIDSEADASFTDEVDHICMVTTADCLPILICNQQGTEVAAVHAGWRGLLNGVIETTLNVLKSPREDLLVWLGPGISQLNFEVGDEVRRPFINLDPAVENMFLPSPNGRWLADLYALARFRLNKQGVTHIYGGDFCTFSDPAHFFSYRRDRTFHGRMASLIWINN